MLQTNPALEGFLEQLSASVPCTFDESSSLIQRVGGSVKQLTGGNYSRMRTLLNDMIAIGKLVYCAIDGDRIIRKPSPNSDRKQQQDASKLLCDVMHRLLDKYRIPTGNLARLISLIPGFRRVDRPIDLIRDLISNGQLLAHLVDDIVIGIGSNVQRVMSPDAVKQLVEQNLTLLRTAHEDGIAVLRQLESVLLDNEYLPINSVTTACSSISATFERLRSSRPKQETIQSLMSQLIAAHSSKLQIAEIDGPALVINGSSAPRTQWKRRN